MSARLLGLGFGCDMGTPCRKLVLLKLIDACEDDGTRIFPAVATIARAAQCSARQVQRELSTFVTVGLLRVVREGGKGPGNTREYAMNVSMLREIEDAGWDAVTAGAAKGDTVSPLDKADKGDTGDTERVTPATDKGDKLSHPTPQYPSNYPSERAAAREREGEIEDRKKIDAAYWRIVRNWPRLQGQPKDRALKAFYALTPEERAEAERKFPAWLALLKSLGKDHIHAPSTYFGEKLFADVPEPQAEPKGPTMAAPFGKLWGAMRFADLIRPHGALPKASPFLEGLMAQDTEAGARERLAHRARWGWPGVNAMHEAASNWRGVVVAPERQWLEAVAASFEQVRVGSDLWAEWKAEHERRGWPWVPDPGRQEWVYFPAGGPAGLEAFEAAIRDEAQGDDGGGREAAE